ncbi:MAG: hypothetical protein IPK79_09840 [Vampirovibrionales bacterium]|nr:hypothetical protein [Vampirovibrionales bacterium]
MAAMTIDPFEHAADAPLVAIPGARNGYLQLAPSTRAICYADLPDVALLAAKDWAARLEALGAPRVYWLTLAEVVRRLHIHLYPRWSDDLARGIALFEARNTAPQPPWTPRTLAERAAWAERWQVAVIDSAP